MFRARGKPWLIVLHVGDVHRQKNVGHSDPSRLIYESVDMKLHAKKHPRYLFRARGTAMINSLTCGWCPKTEECS